jgi:hypothetical protein
VLQLTSNSRWSEIRNTRAEYKAELELSRLLAAMIGAEPPRDKLIATVGIGAFGYFSSARILDMVGLVDRRIATSRRSTGKDQVIAAPGHQRSNAEYVLGRAPDFIAIPRRGVPSVPIPAIIDLWRSKDLDRLYVWDDRLHAYRRRPEAHAEPGEAAH